MAKLYKPKLSQKIAGGIGKVGINAIKIKRDITHPHEELIYRGFRKFQDYSKKNTGLKGPIRHRIQVYNTKTNRFVKFNTQSGRILGSSRNPYKRVRRNYKQTKRKFI